MEAIYFDMDGTIASLYDYENWLPLLKASDVSPYLYCSPRVECINFIDIINKIKAKGIKVGIISWTAKGGSKEYNKKVRKAKMQWIKNHFGNIFDEYHIVKYGTSKHSVATIKNSILVDDDINVRNKWNGQTIDANNCVEMMNELELIAA